VKKTLAREALIKRVQPKDPMTYLWFIGVNLADQDKGIGSKLLQSVIDHGIQNERPIFAIVPRPLLSAKLPFFRTYHQKEYSEPVYLPKCFCRGLPGERTTPARKLTALWIKGLLRR